MGLASSLPLSAEEVSALRRETKCKSRYNERSSLIVNENARLMYGGRLRVGNWACMYVLKNTYDVLKTGAASSIERGMIEVRECMLVQCSRDSNGYGEKLIFYLQIPDYVTQTMLQ